MLFIYFVRFGLFYPKVRLAMAEKGLSCKERDVSLPLNEHNEPWFIRLNPSGEVPVLIHGSTVICNTTHIIDFLEDTFQQGESHPCTTCEHFNSRLTCQSKFVKNLEPNMDFLTRHVIWTCLSHPTFVCTACCPFALVCAAYRPFPCAPYRLVDTSNLFPYFHYSICSSFSISCYPNHALLLYFFNYYCCCCFIFQAGMIQAALGPQFIFATFQFECVKVKCFVPWFKIFHLHQNRFHPHLLLIYFLNCPFPELL